MPVKKKTPRPTAQRSSNGSRPRRGTKEATRARLLQSAIDVIRKGGVEAVSTVSVTKAAGFAQSSFYMHFTSVDACLRAAAGQVAREVRAFIANHRRRTHEAVLANAATPLAHFDAVLRLFLEQRKFAEILLRHRHDRSPLGKVMRQMTDGIRADLIADSWSVAESFGVHRKHYERVALTAEFLHAQVMAAGEALLDGRFSNAEMIATELAATAEATIKAALARCLGGAEGRRGKLN